MVPTQRTLIKGLRNPMIFSKPKRGSKNYTIKPKSHKNSKTFTLCPKRVFQLFFTKVRPLYRECPRRQLHKFRSEEQSKIEWKII